MGTRRRRHRLPIGTNARQLLGSQRAGRLRTADCMRRCAGREGREGPQHAERRGAKALSRTWLSQESVGALGIPV